MNRRDFLKNLGLGAMTLTLPACQSPSKQPTNSVNDEQQTSSVPGKKPNFVFILIDDMGWMDAGCYGSTFYETPNIDRLAAEGMRFTDAYAACPVCSPTRASIMTGKYPARLNLTDWLIGRRWPKDSPIVPVEWRHEMPLEEVTIAESLKEAGYATCFVGKWHLGKEPFYPEHQGFDINIGGTNSGMPKSHFYPRWADNPPIEGKPGEYLADRLTDESLNFLETNADKPFLLYLSHYGVHTPLEAKGQLLEKYRTKANTLPQVKGPRFIQEGKRHARQVQDHPVYGGMVQSIDESVGRVMDKLKELNLAENTVVFFMSDNGGLSTSEGSPTSNVPLRAGKGWLYEGGIREPMIIKWPGAVEPGSVCSEPVTSTDFYPTILEMANLPLKPQQHPDGVSLVPLLAQTGKLKRKAIYWHYPHYSNQGGTPGGAIRLGDYKLIEFYDTHRTELYNLRDDIGEKHDLSSQKPQKTAELKKMLEDWRKTVDAQMPKRKEQKV